MSSALPLISVRDLRESVHAGCGNATATVRLLDGVSLSIHAGELLLVHGTVASGAGSLRSALAAPRRGVAGERVVAHGVCVRRASVTEAACDAIVAGWNGEPPPSVMAARVVYLLRVRASPRFRQLLGASAPALTDAARAAWRDWALTLRRSGSAVVLFNADAEIASTSALPASVAGAATRTRRNAVHEDLVASREWNAHQTMDDQRRTRASAHGHVRGLALSQGRIVSEWVISAERRPSERPSAPTPDGDDASR